MECGLRGGKKRNIGLIAVTHNMHLAKKIATRIVDLQNRD